MATNANIFNSRVTSEALEAKFRQVFPAQAGAELIQDLYASGVIQPVVDFSSVAEGSVLPTELQQCIDFGVSSTTTANTSDNIITGTGFWKVWYTVSARQEGATGDFKAQFKMTDGLSTKTLVDYDIRHAGTEPRSFDIEGYTMIIFVKAGESVSQSTNNAACQIHSIVRQIADVNGNLTNPLGFSFS